MKLESEIKSKCMKTVRRLGGYIYKNAQSMYTEKGRPDLTACIPVKLSKLKELFGYDATIGVFVGLETKRDSRKYDATEAQEIVGRQIKDAKGLWFKVEDPELLEALILKLIGD